MHVQINDPVLELAEDNVAAVLGHGRANPRFQKLLDLGHDLGLRTVSGLALGRCGSRQQHGLAGNEVLQ